MTPELDLERREAPRCKRSWEQVFKVRRKAKKIKVVTSGLRLKCLKELEKEMSL